MLEVPDSQPRPTDQLLRAVCCAACFLGLGLEGYPHCFWMDTLRLVTGAPPQPTFAGLAVPAVGYAGVAWLLGATLETGLVALGLRLTRPPEQAADYDDEALPP